MGLLSRGMTWLAAVEDSQEDDDEHTITYTQEGYSVTIPATIGRTPRSNADIGNGANKVTRADRDYLITASRLVLNGSAVKPKRGATIVDSRDGKTYEVTPIDNTHCYENSDPEGVKLRVHCMKVN